jgi:hypothetical protein
MQVRPDALAGHLERKLAAIYVVHGDEPLLVLEAGDMIRAAARRAGCDEREVFVVEPAFRWDAFLGNNANLGLFGTRRLVDLRIPPASPASRAARRSRTYAKDPNPDNVTLVTLPKVDRATQSSAWFSALVDAGVEVPVWPVERERCRAGSLRASRSKARACRPKRSRSSRRRARATCSPRSRSSRSSRCSCPRARSITTRSSTRSRTWRATTSPRSPRRGSAEKARARCES